VSGASVEKTLHHMNRSVSIWNIIISRYRWNTTPCILKWKQKEGFQNQVKSPPTDGLYWGCTIHRREIKIWMPSVCVCVCMCTKLGAVR
jgi:hypothetical protein